jgi:plasmid stability protein
MSKATLYLDDDLHRALRMKAAETSESMSKLVNDALRALLADDFEDISDWNARLSEGSIGYEEFLKQLRDDGTI